MIWFREGLRLLAASRLRSLALFLVWFLLFSLIQLLEWSWANSGELRRSWQNRLIVELYLTEGAEPEALRAAAEEGGVFQWNGMLAQQQAAEEFEASFGMDVLELLGRNPFPRTALLTLDPGRSREEWAPRLDELSSRPDVAGLWADPLLLRQGGRGLRAFMATALGTLILLLLLAAFLMRAMWRGVERSWKETGGLLELSGAPRLRRRLPPALALTLPALGAAMLFLLMLFAGIRLLAPVLPETASLGFGVSLAIGVGIVPALMLFGIRTRED